MAARKFLALIGGVLRELRETELTIVVFNLTTAGNPPVGVVKEKVERLEYVSASTCRIHLDSGDNFVVNTSLPVTKDTLDAA